MNDPLVTYDLALAKVIYGERFIALRAIINRYDPIGLLATGAPEDEYEPEVKTIILQLKGGMTQDEVMDLIHREFLRWFNNASTTITEETYHLIARDIHAWSASQEW